MLSVMSLRWCPLVYFFFIFFFILFHLFTPLHRPTLFSAFDFTAKAKPNME